MHTDQKIAEWLEEALPERSRVRMANMVAEAQGRTPSHMLTTRLLKGQRRFGAGDLLWFEFFTKKAFPTLMRVAVRAVIDSPLIGRPPAAASEVPAPREAVPETQVIQVVSDILSPFIPAGSLIFYDVEIDAGELVGRPAVAEISPDGEVMFGVVAREPNGSHYLVDIRNPDTTAPVMRITKAAPVKWVRYG